MRPVERIVQSQEADVGTFTVRRALPDRQRHSVGPWVFLDHFGPFRVTPGKDGVGAHPHAGIETVTYLLSGRQQHRDSAGHTGIVTAGGAQWMTAGRGIVHAETPMPLDEAQHTLHGIQLWTTLPRALRRRRYPLLAVASLSALCESWACQPPPEPRPAGSRRSGRVHRTPGLHTQTTTSPPRTAIA